MTIVACFSPRWGFLLALVFAFLVFFLERERDRGGERDRRNLKQTLCPA